MNKYQLIILAIVVGVLGAVSLTFSLERKVVLLTDEIDEPSGIVYHEQRNTLFVVDDEGELFEIDLDGNFLRQVYVGDYDLEGITISGSGQLILAAEGRSSLIILDVESLDLLNELPILTLDHNGDIIVGDESDYHIEGIHYSNGRIYLAHQSNNTNPAEVDDYSSGILTARITSRSVRIRDRAYFPFPDLAGIAEWDGNLYVLSSDENVILVYNRETNTLIDQIENPVSGDQEGITFDTDGNMYIAVDGGGVFKSTL